MPPMQRFCAPLLPVPHGGHYVVVAPAVAEAAGIEHHSRVRGTCNGVAYRSSTPIYSGAYHLGLHKAMLAEAGAAPGDEVTITIELDTEPLPTDVLPDDLAAALARDAKAAAAWQAGAAAVSQTRAREGNPRGQEARDARGARQQSDRDAARREESLTCSPNALSRRRTAELYSAP